MKKQKLNNKKILHSAIKNILLSNGKKFTIEKILLKFSKLFQKSLKKNFKQSFQLSIVNLSFAFECYERTIKKSRKKVKNFVSFFISIKFHRILAIFKLIKIILKENNSFTKSLHTKLNKEILNSFESQGLFVEQKIKLKIKTLENKRYLTKYKW